MKNLINQRVSVEKILTENWESPMVMRNAIVKDVTNNGEIAHIITDEKTIYETYNRGGSGHYYFTAFNIKLENKKNN